MIKIHNWFTLIHNWIIWKACFKQIARLSKQASLQTYISTCLFLWLRNSLAGWPCSPREWHGLCSHGGLKKRERYMSCYLTGRMTEREVGIKGRQETDLAFTGLLSSIQASPGQSQEPGTLPGSHTRIVGLKPSSPHLLLLWHLSRELDWSRVPGIWTSIQYGMEAQPQHRGYTVRVDTAFPISTFVCVCV